MSRRRVTTYGFEPFDLGRVANDGDAWAIVTTPDGDKQLGRLDIDLMLVEIGTQEVKQTQAASKARAGRHGLAMLVVGWMTEDGRSTKEIVRALVDRKLMSAKADADNQRRRVYLLLAEYKQALGRP